MLANETLKGFEHDLSTQYAYTRMHCMHCACSSARSEAGASPNLLVLPNSQEYLCLHADGICEGDLSFDVSECLMHQPWRSWIGRTTEMEDHISHK
jgi:hypothetical protein